MKMSNYIRTALRIDFSNIQSVWGGMFHKKKDEFEEAVRQSELEANGSMSYHGDGDRTTYPDFHGDIEHITNLAEHFNDVCSVRVSHISVGSERPVDEENMKRFGVSENTNVVWIRFQHNPLP
jgi:hypothetical protein